MPNCHTNCFCTIEYPTSTQCIVLNYIYQWFPNPLDHDIPSGSPAPDSICDVRKLFLFWLPIQKDWKAKLESAYSFMFQFSKITVCLDFIFLPLQLSFEQKPHVCPPMNWKPTKRAELLLVNRSRFSLIKNWGNVFISKKRGKPGIST